MKCKNIFSKAIPAVTFLLMILDSKHCLSAAKDAVDMCIQSLIPSLFPFLFLSIYLCDRLGNAGIRLLRFPRRLIGMPEGSESILLLGLIGGYPVGAQAIAHANSRGNIARSEANRLVSFCNNAGPAFIFGMCSVLFDTKWAPWFLWGIQVASAFLVGVLSRKSPTSSRAENKVTSPMHMTAILERSVKTMGSICGWVILFRIMIHFASRWFLWLLPEYLRIILCGSTELVNGIMLLPTVKSRAFRFILASGLLSFGGICVTMQTKSVAPFLDLKKYLAGKMQQTLFSMMLALPTASLLFQERSSAVQLTISLIILIIVPLIPYKLKNKTGKTANRVV